MKKRIACLLALACATALAQNSGSIAGVVVDENGKPVARAQVHIGEPKPFVGHRLVKFHETSDDGRFEFQNVPWGTYVVMGGKKTPVTPTRSWLFTAAWPNLPSPWPHRRRLRM